MPPRKPKSTLGKRVKESFFTRVEGQDDICKCICGVSRKQGSSGYSNFLSHVQEKHAEEFKRVREIDNAERNDVGSQTSLVDSYLSKVSQVL